MIFRHEFIQLIYLRENGFDTINYKNRGKRYLPHICLNDCPKCGLKLEKDLSCFICDRDYMKNVERVIGI